MPRDDVLRCAWNGRSGVVGRQPRGSAMPRRRTPCHLAALLAACLGSLAAGTGIARASIISSSPAFPPLGAPFIALTGLGCFPTAGFCTTNGAISFSPADPPTSTFDPSTGQDIKGDVTFTGMLTTLGPNPVPIGSFSFPGTIEMGVAGRMSDTETGTLGAPKSTRCRSPRACKAVLSQLACRPRPRQPVWCQSSRLQVRMVCFASTASSMYLWI